MSYRDELTFLNYDEDDYYDDLEKRLGRGWGRGGARLPSNLRNAPSWDRLARNNATVGGAMGMRGGGSTRSRALKVGAAVGAGTAAATAGGLGAAALYSSRKQKRRGKRDGDGDGQINE